MFYTKGVGVLHTSSLRGIPKLKGKYSLQNRYVVSVHHKHFSSFGMRRIVRFSDPRNNRLEMEKNYFEYIPLTGALDIWVSDIFADVKCSPVVAHSS